MADPLAQHKIHYKDGVWYANLPREAQQASQQLKAAGWWFHWGDDRDPRFCGGCKANLPALARFTPKADIAAPFRKYFDEEAERAFAVEAVEVKKRADAGKKAEELSRSADVELDIPAPPGLDYRGYQRAGVAWITSRSATLLGDEQGLGKAQPVDTPVLTPTGWRPIGRLSAGDEVIGSSGRAVRVTGVFHRGVMRCLRVTFNDGTSTRVAEDHLWAYRTHNDQQRNWKWRVAETRDLVGRLRTPKGDRDMRVPLVGPVQFESAAELPLDPYLLGVLLGDGHLAHHPATYTPGNDAVPDFVQAVLPEGCSQSPVRQPDRAVTYRIVTEPRTAPNPVLDEMRALGLAYIPPDERHVPDVYLFGSAKQRLHLLHGLLDTDGEITGEHVEFSSASQKLVEQVAFLCESFGGVARMGKPRRDDGTVRECRMSYRVGLSFPPGLVPFRARGQDFVPKTKYPPARIFDSIEPCGEHEVACIAVDAPDGLYVTEHCIVTHNTIQVMGAINLLPDVREVLVIAPSHLLRNWTREARKWSVRPIDATVLNTSEDIPPPAEPGSVNVLVTNYEKLIEQKGADLEVELKKGKNGFQKDFMGLRRALAKVADNPKALSRILVFSDGPGDIDWTKAVTPRLRQKLDGDVKMLVVKDVEQLKTAQRWVAEHPQDISAVVVHITREQEVLAAMQGGIKNLWDPIRKVALGFTLGDLSGRGAMSSSRGHQGPAYDIFVGGRGLVNLRTSGRAKGLHAALMGLSYDMLVLDEMHGLNNPKSAQSIAVYGQEDRGKLLKPGLDSRAKRKVYLSGTAMRNVVCEMWGMLHSLAPRTFYNFMKFAKRYCGAYKGQFGWDFSGATNLPELQRTLRAGTEHRGLMISRLKAEVAPELPPKTRHVLALEPDDRAQEIIDRQIERMAPVQEQLDALEVQALIAQMQGDSEAYEDAVGRLQGAQAVAFEDVARERAELGRLKVLPSVEYIRGLLEEGVNKVIVFAHHRDVIDGLTDGLRQYGCAIIDGRAPGKGRLVFEKGDPRVIDRIEIVDAFQTDPKVRVFIGNFKAASTGLTLTASSTVVLVESTWTGAENAQAEDRAHRIGTTSHVHCVYLVFDGSMDQRMLEAVVRKMDTAYQALHAQREHSAPQDITAIPAQELSTSLTAVPIPPEPKGRPGRGQRVEYSDEVREAAQAAIAILAGVCDGARKRDCQGFSGTWVNAGHWLAGQPVFDDRMVGIALRIITYHQRQVPAELLEILNVERKTYGPVLGAAPHRVQLCRVGTKWFVEDTATEPDEPVQVLTAFPIARHEGTLSEGIDLVASEDEEGRYSAQGVDVWLSPGVVPVFEQRVAVPEPKSKYPVRWFSGRYQRELKQGWTDIDYKWVGDTFTGQNLELTTARAAKVKAPPKAPSAKPKPIAKAPSAKPKPASEPERKSEIEVELPEAPAPVETSVTPAAAAPPIVPEPRAATPRAPGPKRPTPKTATPKRPSARKPSAEKPSETKPEGHKLYIFDPIAIDVMGMLEGPQWREIQRRDESRLKVDNGFYLSLRAYETLVEQGLLGVEGITLEDLDPAAGLIQGAGGTAYIVHPDGQIMMLGDTATRAKAKEASAFMWVYRE